jgi:hypothetical protein
MSLMFGAAAVVVLGCLFAVSHTRDARASEAAIASPPVAIEPGSIDHTPMALPPPVAPIAPPVAPVATTVTAPAAPAAAKAFTAASSTKGNVAKVDPATAADIVTGKRVLFNGVALSPASAAATSTMMRRNQHSTGDVRRTSAAIVRSGSGAHRIERDGTMSAY